MEVDVIVVGGGSAGCVLASQVAADPGCVVLMLEQGPTAEAHPETLAADGYKDAFANDAVFQERYTAAQPGAGGRELFAGTGRVLGGSGSVNGMVYTRGARQDFDAWPVGWRWEDLVPDFEAVEAVLRPHRRPPTAWTEAVLQAADEVGFRRSDDLHDGDLSGVMGYEWMSYDGADRRSSYVAFVRDRAATRPNLAVRAGAVVQRVLFEGRRAVGVEVSEGGALRQVRARRAVVLCAGALETPKLLMLSGVGPGEHLRARGVEVVHDLAGVGENLHDHPNVLQLFLGSREVDCQYPQLYGFHRADPLSELPPGQSDTCYVAWPARSALKEAMQRMLPGLVLPGGLRTSSRAKGVLRGGVRAAFGPRAVRALVERMWGVVVILGKPYSRGRLRLRSREVADDADIDPAYLSDPRDKRAMIAGMALARRMAQAPALAAWGNRGLLPPLSPRSEDAWRRHLRANVMTTYHFAGTCRMGDDTASVVDPRLWVRGLQGLMVADASVIPETPVSALNAPSMVIGLRGARSLGAA